MNFQPPIFRPIDPPGPLNEAELVLIEKDMLPPVELFKTREPPVGEAVNEA